MIHPIDCGCVVTTEEIYVWCEKHQNDKEWYKALTRYRDNEVFREVCIFTNYIFQISSSCARPFLK